MRRVISCWSPNSTWASGDSCRVCRKACCCFSSSSFIASTWFFRASTSSSCSLLWSWSCASSNLRKGPHHNHHLSLDPSTSASLGDVPSQSPYKTDTCKGLLMAIIAILVCHLLYCRLNTFEIRDMRSEGWCCFFKNKREEKKSKSSLFSVTVSQNLLFPLAKSKCMAWKQCRSTPAGFFQKLSLKGICSCAHPLSNISSYSWKLNCVANDSVWLDYHSFATAGNFKAERSWNPSFLLAVCRAVIFLCLRRSIFTYISILIHKLPAENYA